MVITRGKGGWGRWKRGKGGLGVVNTEYNIQVMYYTPETYIILLTNATPINLSKMKYNNSERKKASLRKMYKGAK